MTTSNANKSAAPARAMLSATSFALAAVLALEVLGVRALPDASDRLVATAGADGQTIYTRVARIPSVEIRVVAAN